MPLFLGGFAKLLPTGTVKYSCPFVRLSARNTSGVTKFVGRVYRGSSCYWDLKLQSPDRLSKPERVPSTVLCGREVDSVCVSTVFMNAFRPKEDRVMMNAIRYISSSYFLHSDRVVWGTVSNVTSYSFVRRVPMKITAVLFVGAFVKHLRY